MHEWQNDLDFLGWGQGTTAKAPTLEEVAAMRLPRTRYMRRACSNPNIARSMWVTGKIWQRLIDCDRFCCCPWYVGLFDNSRLFRVWGQIFVISPARRSLGRTVLQNLYMPFWLWACYGWHVGHVCWLCWPRFWEVFHAVVLVSVKSVGASTWMACEGCFCPAYTIQCNASRF
jgi:hypothetical protein